MGQALIRELDNSQIQVVAGIDKQLDIYADFPIYSVAPSEMEVDVIVVTATFFYREIKQDLKEIVGSTPIVSLEDIIIECEDKLLKHERGL